MNPGLFNKRITFEQRPNPDETDSEGYPLKEWKPVKTVWAMPKTVSGREYNQAATTQNELTTRWVIRYTRGLNEDMRIVYKDGDTVRYFEIVAILPDDEQKKTLTVVSKEAK
ncbi:phage head closure protein [Peribacillus kribbensis]|uniref:phage head closure protein n=1 Tax=Peribacillus kribbensis TaxID=356658 RepID=UPI000406A242|nr:phage head closure protein [Peribacillus kribbensis]